MTPASEGDYDAICAAVMETVRGRWFLSEYSRRNRHADTQLVLAALDHIERGLRGRQTPEAVERLRNDLMEMARAIARTKAEIAGVSPADEDYPIGDVSLELDSVVRATNEATSNILAAAAQIQEVAWTMREQGNDTQLSDQLSAYAATIQTAASSQKLAGERTQKVVDVMRDLEGRINDMIDVWGGYPAVDNRLLANSARNTPALPPADFGQVEIDTPIDVEPQQNSSDENDATSTASLEENRPRHLNDNGRARSTNGHLVLDPSIAAAIRDAASLTDTDGAEVKAETTAQVADVADTGFPSAGTPQGEANGAGKDADPSRTLDSPAPTRVMEVEVPENSEPRVAEPAVLADAGAEAPRRESAPTPEALSEPVAHAAIGEVSADNVGPDTGSVDAGTEAASRTETTPSALALEEANPSSSSDSQTIVAPAPSAGGLAAVAETAEPDQQVEPLTETEPDGHETRDAQGASTVELPANPRPFELVLEPLPIELDYEASPSPAPDTTARGGAREETSPTASEPKSYGWLSEPVTALYDLPPLEVSAPAAEPSATTHRVTTSDSAPDASPTRPSQSTSRWRFLSPRSRTKPTGPAEPTPKETTAPPARLAASLATTNVTAFELGGLVVVAPPSASEPREPAVAAAPLPAAFGPSTPAMAALPASQAASPVTAAAAAPAALPEGSKSRAPDAVAMPAVSEPSAPVVAAAVPPVASEPSAPPAASDPAGHVATAGATAKSATSSVKVLRSLPPPPSDPLAALAALSDEEKLALFS